MLHYLREHGSVVPLIVMLGFMGMAALVLMYVLTDRRRSHLRRMESLPLDDGRPVDPSADGASHG
jgi:hypothetical protein